LHLFTDFMGAVLISGTSTGMGTAALGTKIKFEMT
jgi:hypothetical protein